MAYSTLSDLKLYMVEEEILQLTDESETGDIDQEKIDACISRADELIDGYLRGRYTVPLTTIPSAIKDISVILTAYYLYKRGMALTLPETLKDDYKIVLSRLKEIQVGRYSPFEDTSNPPPVWIQTSNSLKRPIVGSIVGAQTNNWALY